MIGAVGEVPQAERARRTRPRFRRQALVFAAVVGLVVWFVVSRPTLEERLISAAEVHGDLEPLSLAELVSGLPAVPDAAPVGPKALQLLGPIGTSLDVRPVIRWSFGSQPGRLLLEVQSSAGELLWERVVYGSQLAYPAEARPLPRDEVVRVRLSRTMGDGLAQLDVRIASVAEATRFQRAKTRVLEVVPDDLRELALAHLALRAGVLNLAHEAAAAASVRFPDDPFVRATLDFAAAGLQIPIPNEA